MTDFRAHVQRANLTIDSLDVVVYTTHSDIDGNYSHAVNQITENGIRFNRVPEMTELPRIRINQDVAKALMLGLLEYFGEYRGDYRIARQDLDLERKRVDRFIEYLTRQ